MPTIAVNTRGDSLAEFLTGASSAGGAQANPALSLGNHRSSTEAACYDIRIDNAITGVSVDFASGGNPAGPGILTAVNTTDLTWRPYGDSLPGAASTFGASGLVEALSKPGQFLRLSAATPFSIGAATITLSEKEENAFGFPNLSVSQAASGISQYRATMVRNVSPGTVSAFKRWIALLGTPQVANSGLGATGAGTIVTTGTFADWPDSGWCQVRNSLGVLKEVVYYESRSATVLNIASSGRALLGTTATAHALADTASPVPGIAIAKEPAGVIGGTTAIQTIASETTAPVGLTWNLGITEATGLNIGTMTAGQQVGIWMRRHCPPGMTSNPSAVTKVNDSFQAA